MKKAFFKVHTLVVTLVVLLFAADGYAKVIVCHEHRCWHLIGGVYSLSISDGKKEIEQFAETKVLQFDAIPELREGVTAVAVLTNKKHPIQEKRALWTATSGILSSLQLVMNYASEFALLQYKFKNFNEPQKLVKAEFLKKKDNTGAEIKDVLTNIKSMPQNKRVEFIKYATRKCIIENPNILVVLINPESFYPWLMHPSRDAGLDKDAKVEALIEEGYRLRLLIKSDITNNTYSDLKGIPLLSVAKTLFMDSIRDVPLSELEQHPVLNMLAVECIQELYNQGGLFLLHKEFLLNKN